MTVSITALRVSELDFSILSATLSETSSLASSTFAGASVVGATSVFASALPTSTSPSVSMVTLTFSSTFFSEISVVMYVFLSLSLLEVISSFIGSCGVGSSCGGGDISLINATSNVPSNSPDFLSISSDSRSGFFCLMLSVISCLNLIGSTNPPNEAGTSCSFNILIYCALCDSTTCKVDSGIPGVLTTDNSNISSNTGALRHLAFISSHRVLCSNTDAPIDT
uniref:Uncharacterized protein n=1 Tax=uncultured marine virus TaxID=186617 RepID=A0A0F7L9I0_9VIRU|nr:hypothetical protein [uncultured marine virus]